MSAAAVRNRRLLVLLLLAGVGAAGVLLTRALVGGDPTAAPTPATSPTATASPTPTSSPAPEQPEPFDVRVTGTKSQRMANARIYGRSSDDGRSRAAVRASRAAVAELTRYLNGAFVREQTRFTVRPAQRLLSWRAEDVLPRRQRRALGADGPAMIGGRTGRARARTVVLHQGSEIVAVTVRFDARMKIDIADKGRGRLRQRGDMVFVPVKGGWRAEMVDVTLRLPGGKK